MAIFSVEVVFLIAFLLVAFWIAAIAYLWSREHFVVAATKLLNSYGISKFSEPVSYFVRSVSQFVHLMSHLSGRFSFHQ